MLIHSAIITGSIQFNNTDVSGITNVSNFASNSSLNALANKNEFYSITSSINTYTASNDSTNTTQNARLTTIESVTGSYATTSSFGAYTASNDSTNTTQNARLTTIESVTGSYATTGSNQFNGNQSISGSIVSNGTITAQTLVVQTISSSIEFVTGSTRNGSLLTNTHQFTGSVGVTGSMSVNAISVTTGTGTANELVYWVSTNSVGTLSVTIYPSLTELSYVKGVTSAIQTQINTKQATVTLTTTGTSGAATFSANTLNIPNYGSALSGYLPLSGGTLTGSANWNTAGIAIDLQNTSYIRFSNSGGTIRTGYIQHDGTTFAFANDVTAGTFSFNRVVNCTGAVLTGALTGTSATFSGILDIFISSTGTYFKGGSDNIARQLKISSSTTTNAGDTHIIDAQSGTGNLVFSTTSTERMRINSDGNVGFGTSFPINATDHRSLTINATSIPRVDLLCGGVSTGIFFASSTFVAINTVTAIPLTFGTNNTERMRIASGGNVLIGTTTDSGYKFDVNGTGRFSGALTITGTTLKATPIAGDIESDTDGIIYYSHTASSRGIISTEQFISIGTTAFTLTSQTAAQKLFNTTTNGAVTVKAATTYYFECFYSLSSLATGTFGFALGGTATITSVAWTSTAVKITTNTTAAPLETTFNTTASNTTIVSSSNQTKGTARITGTIRINAAGTLIPQVSLGAASAAVVGVNSYFRIIPIGTNIVNFTGNWS